MKLRSLKDYEKALNQAVQETGINLNLARPFKLTIIDLISPIKERCWTAAEILSRYQKKLNISNSLQGGPAISFDETNLTITSLVSQQSLHLPELSYLLDYQTKKWYSVKLEISSRSYVEKIEHFECGDSLLFPISTLNYKIVELVELSEMETKEAKNYFNYNWITGQNPKYIELNSWIRGEFRRQHEFTSLSSQIITISEQSELLLQNLLKAKAA